jgi:hypothetical protein
MVKSLTPTERPRSLRIEAVFVNEVRELGIGCEPWVVRCMAEFPGDGWVWFTEQIAEGFARRELSVQKRPPVSSLFPI